MAVGAPGWFTNGSSEAGRRALEAAGISTPSQWPVDRQIRDIRHVLEGVYVVGSDFLVMARRMMFCEVVCFVVLALFPRELKVLFRLLVLEPIVVPHIDRFGTLLFEVLVDKVNSGGVVKGNFGWWLDVAHFSCGDAEWNGLFAIHKGCPDFCICCGRGYQLQDVCRIEDGAVL